MRRIILRCTAVACVVAIPACTKVRQSESMEAGRASDDAAISEYLRRSGNDRPDIVIEIRADRTDLRAGDTVHFSVIARNAGASRVQVGVQCGPAMDVRMTHPDGSVRSVLHEQYRDAPVPIAFTCELGPYHFAEARDSLVNRLWWKAPRARGRYVAVAGARGNGALDDLSAPLSITVR